MKSIFEISDSKLVYIAFYISDNNNCVASLMEPIDKLSKSSPLRLESRTSHFDCASDCVLVKLIKSIV